MNALLILVVVHCTSLCQRYKNNPHNYSLKLKMLFGQFANNTISVRNSDTFSKLANTICYARGANLVVPIVHVCEKQAEFLESGTW